MSGQTQERRTQQAQPPVPVPQHAPTGGKRPAKALKSIARGHAKKTVRKQKRARETADVALEQVLKKREELQKAERRACNAVSKDFFAKKWKTEIWTKTFKEMIDRMIRTLRDRIASSSRLMTKRTLDLILYNMMPAGEERVLFHFDLQHGQNNKTMQTLETISIIGTLDYAQPRAAANMQVPIAYESLKLKLRLCHGEQNSKQCAYDSEDAFRIMVHFVRACTSKRNKDEAAAASGGGGGGGSEDDDANDAAEDIIATFTDDQRNVFMNEFLSRALVYLCLLGEYMDDTLKPKNQFISKTVLCQYMMVALHNGDD